VRCRLTGKRLFAELGQRERQNRLKNVSGMASAIRPAYAPVAEAVHDPWISKMSRGG